MKKILAIAMSQFGVTEIVGKNHNPIILDYFQQIGHSWVKADETAWCSAFMNWVALLAGVERTGKLNARSWLNVGQVIQNPMQGDVVVFWREKKSSWKGHVGIFISYTHDKKGIYVLGGNQNNMVNIKRYPASRLLGYRRLKNV